MAYDQDKYIDFDELLDCAIGLSAQNGDPDYVAGLVDLIDAVLPIDNDGGVKVVLKKLLGSNTL